MVLDGTGGRWREGIEIIGARGMLSGGGGPITPAVKDEIGGIEGIGGGPIGAVLIAGGGGPRFRGVNVLPRGGGIGAELTEHMEAEPREDGPIGAAGLGKGGKREW